MEPDYYKQKECWNYNKNRNSIQQFGKKTEQQGIVIIGIVTIKNGLKHE